MTAEPNSQPLELLLAEVSAALADALDLLRQKKDATEEVAASLSELVAALQEHASSGPAAIAAALRELRLEAPQVHVTNKVDVPQTLVENHIDVQPTPIENHNHITVQPPEAAPPREFEINNVNYDNLGRITSARIRSVPKRD